MFLNSSYYSSHNIQKRNGNSKNQRRNDRDRKNGRNGKNGSRRGGKDGGRDENRLPKDKDAAEDFLNK